MAGPAFLAWCQQHHIQTSRVEPGYVAEGWRGIVATEPIHPDTVIMRVPGKLLMSVVSAKQEPQLASVLSRHQLNSHQLLSIHLLHEASKGPASFWHPYLRQLPRQFTTLMSWPVAAVEALQLPYAQEAAAAAQQKARSEWAAARPALKELGLPKKYLSWHAWCWAASCVLSRTMYHPEDPSCGCLTPLADLHNYQPPPAPHEVVLRHSAEQLLQQQQQQQQPHCTAGNGSVQPEFHPEQVPIGAAAPRQSQQQQQDDEQGDHAVTQKSRRSSDAARRAVPGGQMPALMGLEKELALVDDILQGQLQQEHLVPQQLHQQQQQQHPQCHCGPQQQPLGQLAASGLQNSLQCAAQDHQQQQQQQQQYGADNTAVSKQLQPPPQDSPVISTSADSLQGSHPAAAEGSNRAPAMDSVGAGANTSDSSTVSMCGSSSVELSACQDSSMLCGDGHYDAGEGIYKILARRRYDPGDQVYLCYGRHTNLDLLELYGFLLETNPHNTALLAVETVQHNLQLLLQRQRQQQAGEGRQWKRQPRQQQLQGYEIGAAAADCWVSATGTPSWELIRALRLATATPAELEHSCYLPHEGSPVSISSEATVLHCLLSSCKQTLDSLPTTVVQDETLLGQLAATAAAAALTTVCRSDMDAETRQPASTAAAGSPQHPGEGDSTLSKEGGQQSGLQHNSECLQLAVTWRLCYKMALARCIQQCEQALELLSIQRPVPSGGNGFAYERLHDGMRTLPSALSAIRST